MSFTRFHDDPARIKKQNMETTAMHEYMLNVPGNSGGIKSHYYNDPHLRLQKNGGAIHTNMVNVESMLKNINRRIIRDDVKQNNYKNKVEHNRKIPTENIEKVITSESRATHPAFEYREKQQYKPNILLTDPQKHIFIPFDHNLDTNILEKDYYNLKNYKQV